MATETEYANSVPNVASWINESNAVGSSAGSYAYLVVIFGGPDPTPYIAGDITNPTLSGASGITSVKIGVAFSGSSSAITPFDAIMAVSYGGAGYCSGHSVAGATAQPTPTLYEYTCSHHSWTVSGLQSNDLDIRIRMSNPGGDADYRVGYFRMVVTYTEPCTPDTDVALSSLAQGTTSGSLDITRGTYSGSCTITNWQYQVDTDPAFSNYLSQQSTSSDIAIGTTSATKTGLSDGRLYYVRTRVKSSDAVYGAWGSATAEMTRYVDAIDPTNSFTVSKTDEVAGGLTVNKPNNPTYNGNAPDYWRSATITPYDCATDLSTVAYLNLNSRASHNLRDSLSNGAIASATVTEYTSVQTTATLSTYDLIVVDDNVWAITSAQMDYYRALAEYGFVIILTGNDTTTNVHVQSTGSITTDDDSNINSVWTWLFTNSTYVNNNDDENYWITAFTSEPIGIRSAVLDHQTNTSYKMGYFVFPPNNQGGGFYFDEYGNAATSGSNETFWQEVINFLMERKEIQQGNYTTLGAWISTGTTTQDHTGLGNNTTYNIYTQFKYNSATREGAWGGRFTQQTTATTPDTPTGTPTLDASTVAGQITVDKTSLGGGDGGEDIDFWTVQYDKVSTFDSGDLGQSSDIAIATDTWDHTSLTKGDTWYYRVKWKNAVGYSSSWSNYASDGVEGTPDAPTLDSVTATGENSFSCAFTHGNNYGQSVTNTRYRIDGGSWVEWGASGSPQTISGLTAGTQYTIDIASYNIHGWSTDSNDIAKYTYTAAPSITQGEPKGLQSMTTTWSQPTGATTYKVEYQENDGGWATYETGVTDVDLYALEGLTNKAEVDVRVTGINPDGVEGTQSAEFTVFVSEINFGVLDYKVIESNPLRQVVRVWMGGGTTTTDAYNRTQPKEGVVWVFDVIVEAGKRAITILPKFQYHNQYAVGLLASLFFGASFDVSIMGLNLSKVADVDGLIENATPNEAITFMLNKTDNMVVGIGANRVESTYAQDDNVNAFMQNVAMSDFKDKRNEDYYFTVFANKFLDFDGNDLTLFKEGEDFDSGINQSVADTGASGGNYGEILNNNTAVWTVGKLKKGTYLALIRLKRSATGNCTFKAERNGTTIASYGYDSGNNAHTFSVGTSYAEYMMEFVVDDTTVNYNFDVGVSSGQAGNGHLDYLILIPLTDGKDMMYDIYLQGLTTNKPKYIGLL